jgi:uncharacterized membrane protein YkvA (DUF1232 family)
LWTPVVGLLDDGLVAAFVVTSVRAATADYVCRGGRRGPRPDVAHRADDASDTGVLVARPPGPR